MTDDLHTEVVLQENGVKVERRLPPGDDVEQHLSEAIARGARVVSVNPRRERLEDLFVREVEAGRERQAAAAATSSTSAATADTVERRA